MVFAHDNAPAHQLNIFTGFGYEEVAGYII
jgi:hypothetical protein